MPSAARQGPPADRRGPSRVLIALMALAVVAGAAVSTSVVAASPLSRAKHGGTAPTTTVATASTSTTGATASTASTATTTTTATTATTQAAATTSTTAASGGTPATAGPVAMRRAALRITIQTSSDWAQVDLPGVSAGHLVVTNTGGSEVVPIASGVVVRGAAGVQRSVIVDVVTEVPGAVDAGWITLQQGGVGSTSATLDNRTAGAYRVVSLTTQGGATATETVSIAKLMGATQLPWRRADDRRRVLAFTYPWFDESAATDPRLSVHPTEPWRSWDPDDALRATRLARESGIDGFVMSWAGAAANGLALYQTLAAAAETNGTATILLETGAAGSAAVAEQWIGEALQQASSPAFMRLDGVPVVFVFDGGRLTNTEWRSISQHLAAAGTPVQLIGDMWDGQGGAITGMYRYNALLQTESDPMTATELTEWNQGISRTLRARATLGSGEPGVVVATVQPGWDDRPLRGADRLTVPWSGTDTYDSTWTSALAGEPDWVVITSWNEWYEGTGIAPSAEHGSAALNATGAWAQRLRG